MEEQNDNPLIKGEFSDKAVDFIDNSNAQAQLQEIKAGGTVHCKDAYTLTDTKTPVTLKFTNGMMGEELGTMTFEVK